MPASATSLNSSYLNEFPIDNVTYWNKSIQEFDFVPREKICLLDSEAPETLSPSDKSQFEYFLAGGILGDVDENDPDRTQELRVLGFPLRNLGKAQMTLDTALLTAHEIIANETPYENLKFIDRPTFPLNEKEFVDMPFKYLDDGSGCPIIPEGMLDLWRKDFEIV